MGLVPAASPHQLFAKFSLDEQSFNLSTLTPFNTARLHASALLGDNTAISAQPSFTILDSDTSITIDSLGTITAKYATATAAKIAVKLTFNGVTRVDTARVTVITGAPPTVQRVSIAPLPGDSAKVVGTLSNFGLTRQQLAVNAFDTNGDPIPGAVFSVKSSDTAIAAIDTSGFLTGRAPGTTMLRVSAFLYGTVFRDSLSFTVGQPLFGTVLSTAHTPTGQRNPVLFFDPGTTIIGVGGDVIWLNTNSTVQDVVFDDPSAAVATTRFSFIPYHTGTGNIPAFKEIFDSTGQLVDANFIARSFPVAGRYPFHSTSNGTSGVIIVCNGTTVKCEP
jgi:hypothetical protein